MTNINIIYKIPWSLREHFGVRFGRAKKQGTTFSLLEASWKLHMRCNLGTQNSPHICGSHAKFQLYIYSTLLSIYALRGTVFFKAKNKANHFGWWHLQASFQ